MRCGEAGDVCLQGQVSFCACARPSSGFHGSVQDPHPGGEIPEVGAGTGGSSSSDGRNTPELHPDTPWPSVGGWLCPRAAREPEGAVSPPCAIVAVGAPSLAPLAPAAAPGVQVMLQSGSTASTERGEQHGDSLHLKGVPLKPFLLLFWPGN